MGTGNARGVSEGRGEAKVEVQLVDIMELDYRRSLPGVEM